jgi:formylglycine-generating enzyme required for sulfatase activity
MGRFSLILTSLAALVVVTVGRADVDKKSDAIVTNSIGMQLAAIPAGDFLMGSPDSDKDALEHEKPQRKVRITRAFYLGTTTVTVGQFKAFVKESGYKTDAERGKATAWKYITAAGKIEEGKAEHNWQNTGLPLGDDFPVLNVTYADAVAFCKWLSAKEGKVYRLPTEAEWEYACRAGTTTRWWSGDDEDGLETSAHLAFYSPKKYGQSEGPKSRLDSYLFMAPVAKYKPNPWGLYDMHGNVWQWCSDWYGPETYKNSPADDPTGPKTGETRVVRGGNWSRGPFHSRSAHRYDMAPEWASLWIGFRVVQEVAGGKPPAQPVIRIEEDAKTFQNTQGQKMGLVKPGEFLMGSPDSDPFALADEKPQHKVFMTRPYYMATTTVTIGQFKAFVKDTGYKTEAEKTGSAWRSVTPGGKLEKGAAGSSWQNTGLELTDEHPVVNVSLNDAVAFCKWLSDKEGRTYRLPTEAEWEYACRAGTMTRWHNGDDEDNVAEVIANLAVGYSSADGFKKTARQNARKTHGLGYLMLAPVGQFQANGWGLHDMHGNVWQWCADVYAEDYYKNTVAENPSGPASGELRVVRGGSWSGTPAQCRSANRSGLDPKSASLWLGFRVVSDVPVSKSAKPKP